MARKSDLKAAAGKAAGAKKTTTTAPKQGTRTVKVKVTREETPSRTFTLNYDNKGQTEAIMTAGKKKETVPYTVRIEKNLLKQWKTYTECGKYGDKSTLTEAALTEYMSRHKLTAEQQAKYNALMEL